MLDFARTLTNSSSLLMPRANRISVEGRFEREVVRSTNDRLESAFASHPLYVNREMTTPCVVGEPLYLHRSVTPEIKRTIEAHNRTIITPYALTRPDNQESLDLKMLASPYECGRVLEYDEKVRVGGEDRVFTVKGGGCTRFFWLTGATMSWMRQCQELFSANDSRHFRKFPFFQNWGSLDSERAKQQLLGGFRLQRRGVDCETIVAIYPIHEIADHRGTLRPVRHYQQIGRIDDGIEPVLMHRAVKSNLRLMDAYMLAELGMKESIGTFAEHVLSEYRIHSGRPRASMTEYYTWLTKKVLSQELPLILAGFQMSSGKWQDLGRNISVLGEELDLEDMQISRWAFDNTMDPLDRVRKHYHNAVHVLALFGDILQRFGGTKIDPMPSTEVILEVSRLALSPESLEPIFERCKERAYGHEKLGGFALGMLRALASPWVDYGSGVSSKGFIRWKKFLGEQFHAAIRDRKLPLST